MRVYYKHLLYLLLLISTTLSSCNKFLDITPKGKTVLNTVTSFDQWLNDMTVLSTGPATLNNFADNVDFVTIKLPITGTRDLSYTWQEQIYDVQAINAPLWRDHFAKINKFNSVLATIDQATNGTERKKAGLKAEALLGRAAEFVYLVNEFGPMYDSLTAKNDLSVPYLTSNDVAQVIPPRGTVQEVYDRIIADIKDALPYLPEDNSNNRVRGSVAAGYSILARVYLFAGNYEEAAKYAQSALQSTTAQLINYNQPFPASTLLTLRQDAIHAQGGGSNATVTLEFAQSFDPNDLRLLLFFTNTDGRTYTQRGATAYIAGPSSPTGQYNSSTSVQEMMLIIAEAAARKGDLNTALSQLNELRKYRFSPSAWKELSSDNKETVLDWVLRERSFEFPFHCIRWFDMRRYDKEGRMGVIKRYDGAGNEIASLPPHSPRYTLQIPTQIMNYHNDWTQNP
jgi:tetratricopeptide (TPR) repeat protein